MILGPNSRVERDDGTLITAIVSIDLSVALEGAELAVVHVDHDGGRIRRESTTLWLRDSDNSYLYLDEEALGLQIGSEATA